MQRLPPGGTGSHSWPCAQGISNSRALLSLAKALLALQPPAPGCSLGQEEESSQDLFEAAGKVGVREVKEEE